MPLRVITVGLPQPTVAEIIRDAFESLRGEMDIPAAFPAEVEREAEGIVANLEGRDPAQAFPDHATDTLDIDFITIDPPTSMDLDQAVHISRSDAGFVVHYAIADVATFVRSGGAIDAEARVRGTTLYAPDGRTPLHPPILSEGAASLLPDEVRPAAVWRIELSADGRIADIGVRRGLVRSRARFSYERAQQILDELDALRQDSTAVANGSDALANVMETERVGVPTIRLLGVVGPLRLAVERARGGVSLNVPEQVVRMTEDDTFELEFRTVLPVEDYNAQISLLAGISAAQLMLRGGVGVLRTLPTADPRDLTRLHRTAQALGLDWPRDLTYGDFLATLDSSNPRHAAFEHEATTLFRGANYLSFSADPRQPQPTNQQGEPLLGDVEVARSEVGEHNAIGAHYAHVTAPLRRLGDRFTTEICLAVAGQYPVPQWVLEALPYLPEWLNAANRRAGSYSRETTGIVEAALLAEHIGAQFTGVVVEADDKNGHRGEIMIPDPAVHARVTADEPLPLGEEITVTLTDADVPRRKIAFRYDDVGSAG
ncbi:RNB domain-containing ribonuclease [Populibacterium corticicola]|uniref:RNB domain-containing ribonuclease n=1 Tax=Populibacterium corticicola TaxID=1812826 RepID=A0ABW5XIS2_9MICO